MSNQLVGFEEGKEIFILIFEYYMTTFIIYHLMTYCEMFIYLLWANFEGKVPS